MTRRSEAGLSGQWQTGNNRFSRDRPNFVFRFVFRYRNCRFGRFGPFSFYIVETAIDFFLFSAETDVGFSVQSEAGGS